MQAFKLFLHALERDLANSNKSVLGSSYEFQFCVKVSLVSDNLNVAFSINLCHSDNQVQIYAYIYTIQLYRL